MLRLAGEVADGSYLGVCSSPSYIRAALDHIAAGAAEVGRAGEHHGIVTLALFAVDDDRGKARARARDVAAWWIAAMGPNAYTDAVGVTEAVRAALASHPSADVDDLAKIVAAELSDTMVDQLTVSGSPEECARAIGRLHDAGSESVVLFPIPVTESGTVLRAGAERVFPLLHAEA